MKATKYTCVLGGTSGLSGHIKRGHGYRTLDGCGVLHRSLEAAERCSEKHTRSLRSNEWARNAIAYSPVSDDSDFGDWGPVREYTAEHMIHEPEKM